jgi:hypothetical protein
MEVSILEVAEGIKPEVVGFLFVNPSYKISDLLRSAFGIALSPPERYRT